MARVALVTISLQFWQSLMTEGNKEPMTECVKGLPEGAEFMYFVTGGRPTVGDLAMVFRHDSFDDIEPGFMIPPVVVEFVLHHVKGGP